MQHRLIEIAKKVRQACITQYQSTEGRCRDISVALAIALSPIGKPVCICSGIITKDDSQYMHTWCRVDHQIIDASSDQFGFEGEVLVGPEEDYPQYKEDQFIIVNPIIVQALLDNL